MGKFGWTSSQPPYFMVLDRPTNAEMIRWVQMKKLYSVVVVVVMGCVSIWKLVGVNIVTPSMFAHYTANLMLLE